MEMSHVKKYLDTRKQGHAHDVARIAAALEMNGWSLLADALRADFAEPSVSEQLAEFFTSEQEATSEELTELCEHLLKNLSEEQLRKVAAAALCLANGLNPDEKTSQESQAETLAAFERASVDAGPETL